MTMVTTMIIRTAVQVRHPHRLHGITLVDIITIATDWTAEHCHSLK